MWHRCRYSALALLAACVALSACASHVPASPTPVPTLTPTPPPATYENPVYPFDFPDPFILRASETYYGFSTNTSDLNVPTIRSTDLVHWKLVADALPDLPEWAARKQELTWAPAVLERGTTYVLYYVARYIKVGRQCISYAVSDHPAGPYTDQSSAPFICQTNLGGSIDPYPFVDDDGKAYLLWKNDGNCCGLPVGIWVQQLGDDGRSLVGEPVELIRRDQSWERPLIENPAMRKHEGTYYLLYSGNWWESAFYAVGYAVCDTISGPCIKPQDEPILGLSGKVMGPGGEAFFTDVKGNLWLAYHAWTSPKIGYPKGTRSLHIDRVTFEGGKPVVHGPSEGPQPLP